jgi:hypothetical protein
MGNECFVNSGKFSVNFIILWFYLKKSVESRKKICYNRIEFLCAGSDGYE